MTEDCRSHFRLRTRDIFHKLIRKFGCDSITPHVPESDTVTHKRLRNLRKLQSRKKKQRSALREAQEENDSEAEEFIIKAKPRRLEHYLYFFTIIMNYPKKNYVVNK